MRSRLEELERQVGEIASQGGVLGGLSASMVFFAIFGFVFVGRRIVGIGVKGGLTPKKDRSYNSPGRS